MAYDIDRKPATWVMARSMQRERLFWLAASVALLLPVAVVVGLLVGYRISAGAATGLLLLVLFAKPYANRYTELHFRLLGGAVAERTVGETLNELRREAGWVVMHDFEQAFEGNVDHLVSGPNGGFMVETKHHRYVDSDLTKAKRQAAKLGRAFGVFVTPVICLRTRGGHAFKHRGVWIVPYRCLLDWLRLQRNDPIPFERLARYADNL